MVELQDIMDLVEIEDILIFKEKIENNLEYSRFIDLYYCNLLHYSKNAEQTQILLDNCCNSRQCDQYGRLPLSYVKSIEQMKVLLVGTKVDMFHLDNDDQLPIENLNQCNSDVELISYLKKKMNKHLNLIKSKLENI